MQKILQVPLQDTTDFYAQIIDGKLIQKMQEKFCTISDIFIVCTDDKGQWVTDMMGNLEDVQKVKNLISVEKLNSIYTRIATSVLEEQIVEDTIYPNLKIAAISIKIENKPILNWLVCAIIEDCESSGYEQDCITDIATKTTTKRFYQALDLLRTGTAEILEAKYKIAKAEAESRRSKSSQEEMTLSLKRTEAVTNIVQMLENDEAVEVVMQETLKIAGTYLDVSSAQVFRLHKDETTMDVMAEWYKQGFVSIFDQVRNIKRLPILHYNKPMAISSETRVSIEEKESMECAFVKATIIIPIFVNNCISMYVCFNECSNDRLWLIDEIKFANSASKILQSVLVRRIQKNSLVSSYASLEAILDNVGSAIYVKDIETKKVLFVNKMLKSNFEKEYKNGTLDELFEKGQPVGNKSATFEINHIVSNRWYDLHYTYINWVDGRQVALCAVYDITDKKIYQRKIEQQAYTDFLTGLYNRMCCERDLAWHVDNAKTMNAQGAILYLDLDDFKHINDGLGHQYGDVLLKAISHSLQKIQGIQNTCYRMGGDEFVIVVPPDSYPRFKLILDEIKEVFNKTWFLKDADYYCTMSMGVVLFPEDGDSVQNLIKKADIAMYEAKKSGKNRVAYYSDNIGSSSNKRLDMEKNMRDATVDGYKEFEVYYQPIIDIQKAGLPCTGAEALIRWNSAELGFISPSDFIPLAEYLGLINPIGNYVLQEACETCKKWNDNGHANYKVNVNLSVVQLLQPDIVEIIADTIEKTGIMPKNLTLEVTESLAINDMERMKEILGSIKKLGVRIALDDFGTGYSSLNHIREIPINVIKVDQSFVMDLADDTYSQSFIKMISELAGSIGVSICVEGIETKEQYKVLEGMQVRLIQGYYFDRPMTRDAFEEKYV
ncbi:MAG: EAL domain-containing protein [Lachnospiraceae bacterium]|nr:EAL domain-containing protein [Lachnospiraceae bacterium]